MTKWKVGKRIVEDELKFSNPEHGNKRVENIAKDLRMSVGDVWACIRFAKKYPITLSDSVRELSWHYISHNLLYEPRKKAKFPKLPPGKYNILYIDPPWRYYEGGYKNQSQHYHTLTVEELKKMPMDDLAADNCILFLWVTFPILNEVFGLIKWWGFNYSTVGFVWVKSKKDNTGFAFGLGNWTRSNVELCLIATKGRIERKDAGISQIIYAPKGRHSKKPDIVRDKIVQLVGDLPRIELFARNKVKGWDSWGNEV